MKKLLMIIICLTPFIYSVSHAHCKAWHPQHCAPVKKISNAAKKAGKKIGSTAKKASNKAWKHTTKELNRTFKTCKLRPDCLSKIRLYQTYMIQLRTGTKMYRLHPKYLRYAYLYRGLSNLNNYRFGYSNRQPRGNATTDCSKTYYNDKSYVRHLRQGTVPAHEMQWLLHELEHYNQCKRVGGRDKYILMWFRHLKPGTSLRKIHGSMKMEKDAKNMSKAYCRQIGSACKLSSRYN